DFAYEEAPPEALRVGDRVCLFTDGVVEQTNQDGLEFGIGGLQDAVRQFAHLSPRVAITSIIQLVEAWRGDIVQKDDYTLVMIAIGYQTASPETSSPGDE
ncbi:SpoIIE family protein phosphatase, partial [Candidatus Poribacteria bacterium]|nr:SpoIIE family protein phosphatase [Candidatus Poribacteria bacterium]